MPWGKDPGALDQGLKGVKPPDAGGGLKGGDKYAGSYTEDIRTGACATGAENICGAGQGFYPELLMILLGEI